MTIKIRKISKINVYKSFQDFTWSEFCKSKTKTGDYLEQILSKFNIFFGENGSGKSSVCNLLKSFSQTQEFQKSLPKEVKIEIEENGNREVCSYSNNQWTKQVSKNAFLFFDLDFINANVHTHGLRSNNRQQGAHTQKAGKLIIDLDEKANNYKKVIEEKKAELVAIGESCSDLLKRKFTENEMKYYGLYKDIVETVKKEKIDELENEAKALSGQLTSLNKLKQEYGKISGLSLIGKIEFTNTLSSKETYDELFTRKIKEKAESEVDELIKAHFEKHKQFIEYAKDQIPGKYQDEACPLCMQPLSNAKKVIEYYRTVFDQTYEQEKRQFLLDIQVLKNEVQTIKAKLGSLSSLTTEVFNGLEKVKNDFEIPDIYQLEEKKGVADRLNKLSLTRIDELATELDSLKSIERNSHSNSKQYDSMKLIVSEAITIINDLNKVIDSKNSIIQSFKDRYSDQNKIKAEITEKSGRQTEVSEILNFLKSEKIELIKSQSKVLTKQDEINKELKKADGDLANHLSNVIPEKIIDRMLLILEKFNLNFTIEHIASNSNTKEYPFSIKIKDQNEFERDFKEGLSEGERQLISLAFFFAMNENLPNKADTVLIFDDPITSLDSPNLKILSDVIHDKVDDFSQVIILTHHPLFYKYLAKKLNPNPNKFNIIKNHQDFGGSFIAFDPIFDLKEEVKLCQKEIEQSAKAGNLQPEAIALKYGQLLRLAVEKFIKHDLLLWDKESNFEENILGNLIKSKSKIQQLDDNDLESISNIYRYCNYANLLHIDKENPSALSELINHINQFKEVLDKVGNPS